VGLVGGVPDLGGVVHDPGARSERMVRWLSSWEEWRVEGEDFIASGDHVVVLCRYAGRGKGSGVDVDTHGASGLGVSPLLPRP
jgi:hypothetical protein